MRAASPCSAGATASRIRGWCRSSRRAWSSSRCTSRRSATTEPVGWRGAAPRERVDYHLGVMSAVVLVLGQRVQRLDFGRGAYVFDRGEMLRAHQAIHAEGRWHWLVQFPVSRETLLTIEVRADQAWPV